MGHIEAVAQEVEQVVCQPGRMLVRSPAPPLRVKLSLSKTPVYEWVNVRN